MMPGDRVAGEEHVVGEQVGVDHAGRQIGAARPARARRARPRSRPPARARPGRPCPGSPRTARASLPATGRWHGSGGSRRRPGAAPPAPRPGRAQRSTVIRRGQRPSRQLTMAAGLSRSRRRALPSRACTGSGQGRPVTGQMLHQAEEERQIARRRPASRRWSGCSARARWRGGSSSSRPLRRCPRTPRAPPARSRRGTPAAPAPAPRCRPPPAQEARRASGIGGERKVDRLLGDADLLDVTARRSRQAATSCSTRSSGAEAPADSPSVRTPSSQAQSTAWTSRHQLGSGGPALARDLGQPHRVRRVGGTHDQEQPGPGCDRRHGLLPVGGGVADVLVARALDRGEAALQHLDDGGGVGQRQGGLRGVGEPGWVGHGHRFGVGHALDQQHRARRPPGPWSRSPPGGRHGRSAARCVPPCGGARPRGAPWRPGGRWRRRTGAGGGGPRPAPPWARRGPRTPPARPRAPRPAPRRTRLPARAARRPRGGCARSRAARRPERRSGAAPP